MTPQQAADMAGVSRQALMKQIHEGEFATGSMVFRATRKGRNWNVEAVSAPTPGKAAPGVPTGTRSQLEILKVKRLYTQIQLDEQKLAQNNRQLRRRFAECVNRAIRSAGADFAGRARALRLPPEQAEEIGKLGQRLKDEFKKRFIEELEELEKEN